MRVAALALALCLLATLVLAPRTTAQGFADVGNVNKLINVVSTPQLAPGDSGVFEFRLNSTYTLPILDVRLNASIYEYATIDMTQPVDASWPYPYPLLEGSGGTRGLEWKWNASRVDAGSVTPLNFSVLTSSDSDRMPQGSLFNQASYFLRFWLEFDGNESGSVTHYRFASRGFFSEARWDRATNATYTSPCVAPYCRGNLNLTILGVDGILPDSSFGVLQPIPRWPFYLLIGLAGLFLVLAFLFWVEENPAAYPRIGAWWARTRGRLRRVAPVRRPRKDAGT